MTLPIFLLNKRLSIFFFTVLWMLPLARILWEVPSLPKADLCISHWTPHPCLPGKVRDVSASCLWCKSFPSEELAQHWIQMWFQSPWPSLSVLTRVGGFLTTCSGPASVADISLLIYFLKIKKKKSHCHYIINSRQIYKNLLVMLFQGTVSQIILIFLRFGIWQKNLGQTIAGDEAREDPSFRCLMYIWTGSLAEPSRSLNKYLSQVLEHFSLLFILWWMYRASLRCSPREELFCSM